MKTNGIYEKILRRKNKHNRKKDPLGTLNKTRTKKLEEALFATLQEEETDYLEQEAQEQIRYEFNI